jgi:hypothetical protein
MTSSFDLAKTIFTSFHTMQDKIEKSIAFIGWINQNFQQAKPYHRKLFWMFTLYWFLLIFLLFFDRYITSELFSKMEIIASSINLTLSVVFAS